MTYNIIAHKEKKSWINLIAIVTGLLSLVGLLLLDFYNGKNSDNIKYLLLTILIIDGFIYSYFKFYKGDFIKTGTLTITDVEILINNKDENLALRKEDVAELKFTLNIIDYVPGPLLKTWISARSARSSNSDGSGNFIEFRHNGKFYSYELYIPDKSALLLLSKKIKEWNAASNIE